MSEKGALVGSKGSITRIESFPATEVDATGAGDMFAGGVLYGLSAGLDIEKSAKLGSFLAAKIVSQMGARLKLDARKAAVEAGLLS